MAYALSSSHKNCLHHTCVHCTLKLSASACIQDCWQWPGRDLIEKHTHTRKNTISMGLVRFEWRYQISSKSRCGEILCQGLIWCVNNSRVASTDQHARAYTASIISLFVCTYNAHMHTHTAIDPLLCSDIETPTILVWKLLLFNLYFDGTRVYMEVADSTTFGGSALDETLAQILYSAAEKNKFLALFHVVPNLPPLVPGLKVTGTDVKSKHLWNCGQWVG